MAEVTATCLECQTDFAYVKKRGNPRRYCDGCMPILWTRWRRKCYLRHADKRRAEARESWQRNRQPVRQLACGDCGAKYEITVVRGRKKPWCDACVKRRRNETKARYRESHREQLREKGRVYRKRRYETDAQFAERQRERSRSIVASRKKRLPIYERDQGVCHICGKFVPLSEFEVDHVIPVSRGGPTTPENLATAHRFCNRSKGARLLEEVTSWPAS